MRMLYLLLLLLFVSGSSYSQDITGRWQGKSYFSGPDGDSAEVYMEIQNDFIANHFTGVTVCVSDNFYGQTSFRGYYNKRRNQYIFIENKVLNHRSSLPVILDKYILTFKGGSGAALVGIVRCNPANADRYNKYLSCDYIRDIKLFKTTEDPPAMQK